MSVRTLFCDHLYTNTRVLGIGEGGVSALDNIKILRNTEGEVKFSSPSSGKNFDQLIMVFDAEASDAVSAAKQYAADTKKNSNGCTFTVGVTTDKKILTDAAQEWFHFDQLIYANKDLLHRPVEMLLFDMVDRGFIGIDETDVMALQKATPQMTHLQAICGSKEGFNESLVALQKKLPPCKGRRSVMCFVQCGIEALMLDLLEDMEAALEVQGNDVVLWQMKENESKSDNRITISVLAGDFSAKV